MRRCATCGKALRGKRADANTCSSACRQALYRANRSGAPQAAQLAAVWRELEAEYGESMPAAPAAVVRNALRERARRKQRDRVAEEMRAVKVRFEAGVCDSCGSTGGWEPGAGAAGWTHARLDGEPWSRMWCPDC